MSVDRFYQIKFASDADRQAWEIDFMAFGSAVVDQHGKYVSLKEFAGDEEDVGLTSSLTQAD